MKRVPLVLVLLVTLSLVSVAAIVPTASADELYVLTDPSDLSAKVGEVDFGTQGSSGDPTGMGTGNGATDDDNLFLRISGAEDSDYTEGGMNENLLFLLSLIQLMSI